MAFLYFLYNLVCRLDWQASRQRRWCDGSKQNFGFQKATGHVFAGSQAVGPTKLVCRYNDCYFRSYLSEMSGRCQGVTDTLNIHIWSDPSFDGGQPASQLVSPYSELNIPSIKSMTSALECI